MSRFHFIPPASTDTTRYDDCPRCGDDDVQGPFDSTPSAKTFVFRRVWFCRRCWWKAEKSLLDDAAKAKADAVAAAK